MGKNISQKGIRFKQISSLMVCFSFKINEKLFLAGKLLNFGFADRFCSNIRIKVKAYNQRVALHSQTAFDIFLCFDIRRNIKMFIYTELTI